MNRIRMFAFGLSALGALSLVVGGPLEGSTCPLEPRCAPRVEVGHGSIEGRLLGIDAPAGWSVVARPLDPGGPGDPDASAADDGTSACVGADGAYRLTHLRAGAVELSVRSPALHVRGAGDEELRFPGPPQPCAVVDVPSGRVERRDLDGGALLTGWIDVEVRRDGVALAGVQVSASRDGRHPIVAHVRTDASGRARLGPLLAGEYELAVAGADRHWFHTTTATAGPAGHADSLDDAGPTGDARAPRAIDVGSVPGELFVFDADGRPAAGWSLELVPAELELETSVARALATCDEHGRVELALAPGVYRLELGGGLAQVRVEWTADGPAHPEIRLGDSAGS